MSIPRLAHRTVARQQGRLLLAHRAQALEMDAASFKEFLCRVEGDALFLRLMDAGVPGGSFIKRQAQGRMRGQSAGTPPDLERISSGSTGFDLGRTLAEHAEGVDALRRLGVEKAKILLEMESLAERKDRIKDWGIAEETATLLQALLEHLSIFDAMTAWGDAVLAPAVPCAIVARFEPGPEKGFLIVPLVSYFRTERYAIDYERITQARRQGIFSETEAKRLPALLGEVEAINYRGDTLHKILCAVADAHAEYLRGGREADLVPLTQLSLAESIGAHPSAVCRTVAGRSVLTPWGEERPLASFFPGKAKRNAQAVAAVLSEEPRLSDREVAQRLRERFGFRISRRSAALYRCGLSIPNCYRRRIEAA